LQQSFGAVSDALEIPNLTAFTGFHNYKPIGIPLTRKDSDKVFGSQSILAISRANTRSCKANPQDKRTLQHNLIQQPLAL
jgi:hypothetical protein